MTFQIAKSWDKVTLRNIGTSLLKSLLAGSVTVLVAFLGQNVDVIAAALHSPLLATLFTLVVRQGIVMFDEWRKGQTGQPQPIDPDFTHGTGSSA